ncbi:MAG: tandem-95 repeat protein, partial [Myxococcota bacterium]
TVTTGPRQGALSLDPETGAFEFNPAADFFGTDGFTVRVTDGTDSVDASFGLRIEPVNDAPRASPVALRGVEDQKIRGSIVATDVDGDKVTYVLGRPPQHGSVAVDPESGALEYTPKTDFFGDDQLSVALRDGKTKSEVQVSIVVDSVNDAPVVTISSIKTKEDVPLKGKVTALDVDSDALTYRVERPATHGEVALDRESGNYEYSPQPDFYGEDRFTVAVDDGTGVGAGDVIVSIEPVNDPPRLSDFAAEGWEDAALRVTLQGSDVDGDALTYRVMAPPRNGSATIEQQTLRYSPLRDFHGEDQLSIEVGDGRASAVAQLRIRILPVNDPPVPVATSLSLDEDVPIEWQLRANDTEGDPLIWAVTQPPAHATVTITNAAQGSIRVVPHANFSGADSFVVTVSDPEASASLSVSLDVKQVNDPPTLGVPKVSTQEDVAAIFTVSAEDVENDTLRYRVLQPPRHGRVESADAPRFQYNPNPDFHGSDTFVLEVSDGRLSARAAVEVEVIPVNDPPSTAPIVARTDEDTATELVVRTNDKDGDVVSVSVQTPPSHGQVTLDERSLTLRYVPNADFAGPDELTLAITDGTAVVTVPVSLEVRPVNDPPTATA